MEQDLQMRIIEDRLNSGEAKYEDVVTVFLAMQRQNFVMANSIQNLVQKWPNPPRVMLVDTRSSNF